MSANATGPGDNPRQGRLIFAGGMPRAGSTLLMNLLGQNPAHVVTPTSGLVHLFTSVLQKWTRCNDFRSQGLEKVKPQVESALHGLLLGYHRESLEQGKIVFDKSRGWLDFAIPLEQITGAPVRMLVVIRDVRAVVASFEKLYRSRGIEWNYPRGEKYTLSETAGGRAKRTLSRDRVTGRSIARIRNAIQTCPDRVVLVPYRKLTAEPQQTMDRVHKLLDLPPHQYNPDHVEQITHEDDNHTGMMLHRIRSKIEPAPEVPWEGVLPPRIAEHLEKRYRDINRLAAGDVQLASGE